MSKRAQVGRGGAALLCMGVLVSCAKEAEEPVVRRERLSVGGEVFRVFCKRSAKAAFPGDLEGTKFNPQCEGKDATESGNEHFDALIARRQRVVDALDRVLGGDEAVAEGLVKAPFDEDEIHTFLGSLVPLYDPPSELMPEGTRALADVLGRLLDENDVTGKKALDVLARTTGRVGYRPLRQALGVIRPVLEYEHLDDFIASSIALTAKGGKAEKEFDALIHALSLELATYEPKPSTPEDTLTIAREFLLSDLWDWAPEPERPKLDQVLLVKRDGRGVAVPLKSGEPFVDADGDGKPDIDGFGRLRLSDKKLAPAPFKVRGEKSVERDNFGAALNTWSDETNDNGQKLWLFDNIDVNSRVLAGLAREQTLLLTTKQKGDRTTVDKLTRGLPGLLGPTAKHSALYGKAKIDWQGPDLTKAPVVDLVHAIGTVVAKPEFAKVLAVLEDQLRNHEAESAELIDALLKADKRADAHPEAQLIGVDGTVESPSRFWDDMIELGRRMSDGKHQGLIEDVMRSLLDDDEPGDEPSIPNKANGQPDESNPPCQGVCAPAQGVMLANWMRFKDHVSYPGTDINAPAQSLANCAADKLPYCEPVDYTARDVGWNRSIFQRVLAMVHSLNGETQCNKPGAVLKGVVAGLDWPLFGGSYSPCDLFEVPDMVEVHILATLNKAQIKLKDGTLTGISNVGCSLAQFGCLGVTQEENSGIHGFDVNPSPESLARFVFAPQNDFGAAMSDPAKTRDGVEIDKWETDALFPMEVVDPAAKPLGQADHAGLNFLQAGRSLMKAFEAHTSRNPAIDSSPALPEPQNWYPGAKDEPYLFGDLLSTLHMHWASRSEEPCNGLPQETCTQSLDPAAPFFTYQSNLRSYEPLIAEIMGDDRLLEVLYRSTKALSETKIGNEDGITILSNFIETLLAPDPALTYRDGRTTAATNLGDDVGYVSPMYLVLDALKGIDKSFATDEHKDRLATWREARSELIDKMMGIEEVDGKKRMADRVGRAVNVKALQFLQERITKHREAGDLEEWASTLDDRLVTQLDKPLVGAALKFMDKAWEDEKAGAELARLTKYLVDEGPGLEASILAGGDLLQLLDDAVSFAPLLDLVAEAVAPGVTESVDVSGKTFSAADGIARKMTELQNAISLIDTKRPSTTAKLLQNLVSDSMGDGSTPLEAILDAIAEVERMDPTEPTDAPLDRADLVAVLKSVHGFIDDGEHGMERLYEVIQHRKRGKGE